jgi:hypothetical protein
VSNPVAPPPPSSGDGFPPPANQGFGSAPQPGQPYGAPPAAGQPVPGQPGPGQPYGDPAQQGFGNAPQQGLGDPGQPGQGAFPAEPKKKNAIGKIALRILGAIVAFVIVIVVKDAFFGDKAKDAAVGDCVASSEDVKVNEETEANAKVVKCDSADAAFTVVGRVEGESDTKSKSCEKFFKDNEEYYVYGSTAGKGYLLCLKPKA